MDSIGPEPDAAERAQRGREHIPGVEEVAPGTRAKAKPRSAGAFEGYVPQASSNRVWKQPRKTIPSPNPAIADQASPRARRAASGKAGDGVDQADGGPSTAVHERPGPEWAYA